VAASRTAAQHHSGAKSWRKNSLIATKEQRLNHFPSIDILRGFAALSVVVYHIIEHFNWVDFPSSGIWLWFRIGWMGVDLFFVISGFVIGMAAFASLEKHGPNSFRRNFFQRRMVRIVPLHYLTMLVFVVFVTPILLFQEFWKNLGLHLVFLHNLFPNFHGAINGSSWSLGTEMQFYLLIMLITPWLYKAHSLKVALCFVLVAWAWRYGVVLNVPLNSEVGPFNIFVAATQLPGMLDEFVAGIILAKFMQTKKGSDWVAASTNKPAAGVMLLLSAVLLYTMLSLFWQYASFWNHTFMVVLFRTLIAISFAAVLLTACLITPTGLARKMLAPLSYLGTVSYGIYLWHLPVVLSIKKIDWLPVQKALPIILILTIVFSMVSWHFFEQPIMKRFSKSR
jgi:peptidoglycan/LPS O-acetylase OafA/YrhL